MWVRINLEKNWRQNIRGPKKKKNKKQPHQKNYFSDVTSYKNLIQTSTPLTNQPSEERILNICKSSWTASVEIKWNIHINYRTITTKFPT